MPDSLSPDQEPDLQAPPRFTQALGELHKESVLVPGTVDAQVLNRVRPQLATIRRRRARRRNTTRLLALAAVFVVMGWIVNLTLNPMPGAGTFAAEDVNHDGKVDILDAFQLAREVKAGKSLPAKLDLNGDGRVDARDVALVAKKAVRLEQAMPMINAQ